MTHLKQVIQKNIADVKEWQYTNLPARVIEYDASTQTATVQTLINYTWSDGVVQEDAIVSDVPVIFPSAGGGIISFPVQVGDTVLLCFSMRSIAEWMEGDGSMSTPEEGRFHELSDAMAIPGLYPKQKSLSPNPDDVEIKFKGNKITLKENGDIDIEAGRINLGADASQSVVLGDALKSYLDGHTHSFTWAGSAGTGVTSSPIVPLPPSTLSNKVFTE